MNPSVARLLCLVCAVVMVATGLGLTRLLVPHQSELAHHLQAALGQLLGFVGLCLVALRMEPRVRPTPRVPAAPVEPHPLAT